MRYRSYSYEDYKRAMDMFGRGIGITTISRALKIPKSTLHYWKNGKYRAPTARWIPEPTNELAYIIGVMLGDGCVLIHGYHYNVELKVKDHEFAEEFSRALSKLLNKKYKNPHWSESHKRWRVYYSSKAFHTWYKEQNLDTLKLYIEYNKDTMKQFLRGIYDSEGCNYRCRKIFLYNNDIKLLNYVQYLLGRYFNIVATGPYLIIRAGEESVKRNGEKIRTNHNNYRISISRRQHIQRFLDEIGFSIREKQQGLTRRK